MRSAGRCSKIPVIFAVDWLWPCSAARLDPDWAPWLENETSTPEGPQPHHFPSSPHLITICFLLSNHPLSVHPPSALKHTHSPSCTPYISNGRSLNTGPSCDEQDLGEGGTGLHSTSLAFTCAGQWHYLLQTESSRMSESSRRKHLQHLLYSAVNWLGALATRSNPGDLRSVSSSRHS